MTSSNTLLSDAPPTASPQERRLDTTPTLGKARRHFLYNVTSNVTFVVLNTGVMLWFTPYLIHNLGVAAYGMIPLVFSVIRHLSIGTEGLNVSIGRFLAIDLNRLDETEANRTFNTAFFISVTAVSIFAPFILASTWWFPVFFQVPVGLENQARILFGCLAMHSLLTVLGSNFGVSSVILHRFDLRNLIKILAFVVRIGLVVALFTTLSAQLWHVGVGFVLAAIVAFCGDWLVWRRLTPQLHIMPSAIDRSRLGQLLDLSGWSIVNRVGLLLFLSIDLIIVNLFFGAEVTGLFGTLLLFPELVRTLIFTISSVLSPAIVARYAVQDFEGVKQLASQAVKLIGISLAIPVGLLCGFARPLLNIWLGPEFQSLDTLLIVMVGPLSVSMATAPLSEVLTSYNKVRLQGTVTIILGIINVGLAFLLAWWGVWGAAGVAVAFAIVFTIRNSIFISIYTAHVMGLKWWIFVPRLSVGMIGTVLVGLCGYGLTQMWWPENWFALGAMAALVSLGYGVGVYFLGLNREDRNLLWGLLPLQNFINARR
ncbi:MAG: hypothetical protein KDI79_04670 [Anaerolineae bacterium]|nr:hypothetical protein [Anaerolineae bacterium]